MASGWNLWVWLECIGVCSGCYCKEVYIDHHILIIIITFPYSTCISSFRGSSIPTSLFIFKMFFRSCFFNVIFVQYSKRCSKNIQNHSKIEIKRTCQYNYIDKNVHRLQVRACPKTSTCEVPRDVSRNLQLTLCAIMAS